MTGGSLSIPFAIGETVWWCGSGYHESHVECPECCGTLALKMTLGNGDVVSVQCEACRIGYDPPRGVVKVQDGTHAPTPYVCQRVEVRGDEIRYQMDTGTGGYWSTEPKDLFRDIDECAAECARRNTAKKKNEEEQHLWSLARHRKSMVWSAHYWRQEVARMEKDLARMRERLAVCPKPRAVKAVSL